jgi:hypothetical protein
VCQLLHGLPGGHFDRAVDLFLARLELFGAGSLPALFFQGNIMSYSGGPTVVRPQLPPFAGVSARQGFFLLSDLHLGHPATDVRLFQADLEDAVARKDRILLGGDALDLILTQDGKRYRPSSIHRRLQGTDDLVGAALIWGTELLAPAAAAGLLDVVGTGNHETAVEKHHSFDVTARLVADLQKLAPAGHKIHYAGYGGYILYKLAGPGWSAPFNLFYWHGAGGAGGGEAAPAGDLFRRSAFIEGADVLWFGHLHQKLVMPEAKLQPPRKGHKIQERTVWLVRTASYLKTYRGQGPKSMARHGRLGNYAADNLMRPRSPGGVRLVVSASAAGTEIEARLT